MTTTTTTTEFVYVGRDNTIDLMLKEDGVIVELHETVTRMDLKFSDRIYEDQYITSVDYPTAFDWVTRGEEGIVILKLGGIELTSGKDTKVELIVYDTINTNGIVWGTVPIRVITNI
jgi:hypothetical protein